MKRTLKYALAASALALLVFGSAAPSQAQYGGMTAPQAAPQDAYRSNAADRNGARADAERDVPTAPGMEAYGYMPAGPGYGGDSCVTQGTYGKDGDYASCY